MNSPNNSPTTEAHFQDLQTSLRRIKNELTEQRLQLEQIRFSTSSQIFKEYFQIVSSRQLSFEETLIRVQKEKLSLARYGDGEIGMAVDPLKDIQFQVNSFELSRRLQQILANPTSELLVALPSMSYDKLWVSTFARFWPAISTLLPENITWGNAQISRPTSFKNNPDHIVQLWRNCWDGKRVALITGKGSRFEYLPIFFDNTREFHLVDSLPRHAFADLERIKRKIFIIEPDLVLVSLGPAGTVLAADLSQLGYQTLDIGHLTASYINAMQDGPVPEKLPFES